MALGRKARMRSREASFDEAAAGYVAGIEKSPPLDAGLRRLDDA